VNTRTGYASSTPFMVACAHGRLEAARFLSTVPGIDLNAVNKAGRSALHLPCRNGHLEVVRFLVALPAGINILLADDLGDNGLHLAVHSGDLPMIQFLLSSNLGFDVEARDNFGRSALLLACVCDHFDVVEYLVTTHNADVQAIDNYGKSCRHFAAKRYHTELIRYLLVNFPGMDFVAKKDNEGNTPLHCLGNGIDSREIARLLLENGAQVNAINNHGSSPLHEVAVQGFLVLVQEFIQHGADLLATDEDGDAPFDVAGRMGEGEIADYILTVAYKDQVLEKEGNRSIHAILDVAEYRYLVVQGLDSSPQRNRKRKRHK